MLDLCAGKFGWSLPFLARGWKVIAVDLVRPDYVPDGVTFYEENILNWDAARVAAEGINFGCASTPCEGFSTMRNFRPPVPYPELGIKLFDHVRSIYNDAGIPYVMENVSGAAKYVGPYVANAGSYYLWGNAVPPILPQGLRKGMTELAMGLREHKGKPGWDVRHGKKGRTPTSKVATIPPELANCVADYAERLLEVTNGKH